MTQEIKIIPEKTSWVLGGVEGERGEEIEAVNDTQWWVTAGGSLCLSW